MYGYIKILKVLIFLFTVNSKSSTLGQTEQAKRFILLHAHTFCVFKVPGDCFVANSCSLTECLYSKKDSGAYYCNKHRSILGKLQNKDKLAYSSNHCTVVCVKIVIAPKNGWVFISSYLYTVHQLRYFWHLNQSTCCKPYCSRLSCAIHKVMAIMNWLIVT